ncbi:prolyl aminopeptidase [Metamycoplasma alkalescens]|uniref:Proline iminopeptidase n=5 Tax=Metamycoplasma alkalescens TaxID=45363 RepID=N9U037_9BACT|nr:prolyl aminopeptidase [Metamycoplasma alkalescens]ENY53922.1 Proline iminopeptidase [Metamycoplasma alkalescens 14918]PYF43642.1 proline iminopeptidase [Metamycoplasma alkalescens]
MFDPIEPYKKGYLKVSDIHQIYYEEVGNPKGSPILFVHGGPGGGISESSRQYFDPKHYRIILFDQRGCGKSLPSAEIKQNTTLDLVNDIEALRIHLNIEKWILFGGSWGSCLSLIYAINYPNATKGLILRGIFLGRDEDNEFLYQKGTSFFMPEAFDEFSSFVLPEERNDLIKAYHKYLNSNDIDIAYKAAYHWAKWELGAVAIEQLPDIETILMDNKANLELARIENHYFINHIFLEDNYILKNIAKIKNIPTIIVHGRYDLICRPEGAYLLHKNLPNSKLQIVTGGHSSKEEKIATALIEATEEFKSL